MSNVPVPEKGSFALKILTVPRGLHPGLYLDGDVALQVGADEVVVIAPNAEEAKLIAANLERTAIKWWSYLVDSQDVINRASEYAAWLELAVSAMTAGELENASRGTGEPKISQATS